MTLGQGQSSARHKLVALTLLLIGFRLFLVIDPPLAEAHALLVRSLPQANARLAQPPTAIEMWFSEPLETGFSKARLLSSSGQDISVGAVILDPSDPTHMTVPLGQLSPGIYTVAWQTLSRVDGHEWYGSFPFTVLNADGSRPSGMVATVDSGGRSELPTFGEALSRWLFLLGSLLFFGAPLFQRFVMPSNTEWGLEDGFALETHSRDLILKAMWIAVALIALGSGMQIVLQALRLGGAGDFA